MVFITHNMALISEIADRIAVMYAGRMVEIASADDIITKPLHPYTQVLMGSIPVIGVEKSLKLIPGESLSLFNPPTGVGFTIDAPSLWIYADLASPY